MIFRPASLPTHLPLSSFVSRFGGISPSDVPLVADVLPLGLVIFFLPKKYICYPIIAYISSCCLPSCAVSDIPLPHVSPTDVDSTVPLGLCGAMVGYKVESRADETTN